MDTCYADTETTSLRNPFLFAGRRTWEVAVIRADETGRAVKATWLQIVDVDLSDANPDSLRVGRFHERFSREEGPRGIFGDLGDGRRVELHGVTEADAAAVIEEITRGAVIAGSNPSFDQLNFAELLGRNFLPAEGWYHHPRDVPNVANGWLRARHQWGRLPDGVLGVDELRDHIDWSASSYSTGKLSEACGIEVPADRHSAWVDAAWCWRWDCKIRGLDGSARRNEGAPGTLTG
jgi:hypothetical protein